MRIGVDVGGTFTDVVLESENQLFSTKVLTSGSAPELAIIEGVLTVIQEANVDLAQIESFIHGTTLATNALIERRGPLTALVTTHGFRDTIEMRTESRFDQYDLNSQLPLPLVERQHRYVLKERMSADGSVLIPLNRDEAFRLAEELASKSYETIAIGFIHSYRNPNHEKELRSILYELLPNAEVSISSEVSPQMREFERFNTVCVNAYIQPLIATYLKNLNKQLHNAGLKCPITLLHSGGGLISLEDAIKFPVRLIESGPAGGANFAAHLAIKNDLNAVLSYDMGGTTAKICLIQDKIPQTAKSFEVARSQRFTKGSGMPISIPVIEMIEIGAGGGSIASVDVLGQIRVGPQSAGSNPGPACYNIGGNDPTVTDADLKLGRLSSKSLETTEIELSYEKAEVALQQGIGNHLGFDSHDAAVGVVEIVDENMANAARVHTVETGRDISKFTMIAFGGAAPLHACRICEKLGIEKLLIPPHAGVGSAIGFLRAPAAYEAIRSHHLPMEEFNSYDANLVLAELTEEACSFVKQVTADNSRLITQRWAYMRYVGQGWEIPVELGSEPFDLLGHELLSNLFIKAYEEFFGRAIENLAIEAVSWAVRVSTPLSEIKKTPKITNLREVKSKIKTEVYDNSLNEITKAAIIDRSSLRSGDHITGPVLITEEQTTTWIPFTHHAVIQSDKSLLITQREFESDE